MARSADGWAIGSKFGAPGVQHGHNDVGEVILCIDDNPVLIDVGVATYTANTFGPNRFKLWSMCSDYHSCPAPNSCNQHNGADYAASPSSFAVSDGKAVFSADMASCYPLVACCSKYVRSITMDESGKGTVLTIDDVYVLTERKAQDRLYFMTCCAAKKLSSRSAGLTLGDRTVVIECGKNLSVDVEEVEIPEPSLQKKWSEGLRRIVFSSDKNAPLEGEYKITIYAK